MPEQNKQPDLLSQIEHAHQQWLAALDEVRVYGVTFMGSGLDMPVKSWPYMKLFEGVSTLTVPG